MRQEVIKKTEDELIATGWVKVSDGLFVDMSDTDDCYGRMLGHQSQKLYCELTRVNKNEIRNRR